MEENKPDNKDDLENLLRKLNLESSDEKQMQEMASFVFTHQEDVPVSPAKEEEFVNQLYTSVNSNQVGGRTSFMFIGIVFVLAGLVFYLIYHLQNNKTITHQISAVKNDNTNDSTLIVARNDTFKLMERRNILPEFGKLRSVGSSRFIMHAEDSLKIIKLLEEVKSPDSRATAAVPAFSQAEFKRFLYLKDMLLKAYYGLDKGVYSRLVGAPVSYCGQEEVVNTLYMRNFDVTNLEYKTFLVDLVLQGRTNDYLKARVNTIGWEQYNLKGFVSSYFQQDEYSDFPVVNITTEGVMLFCEWLQTEGEKYRQAHHLKKKKLKVRLPYDTEWILAAYMGYTNVPNCKGFNSLFSVEEGYVNKGFEKRTDMINRRRKRSDKDSVESWYCLNRFGFSEHKTREIYEEAFRRYSFAPIDTLFSKRIKTYCAIAHVNEIIVDFKTGKPKLLGSCWENKTTFMQMNNRFIELGYSPYVGFRPVIIDEDEPEYLNPFY